MRIQKLTHACVRVEDGDRAIAIDPGVFSEAAEALDGVAAILVTHEHADHVDVDAVTAALAADSSLRLYAPEAVASQFTSDQATSVAAGESLEVAGFAVSTYGGQHALIHPLIPMCANVGFRIASGDVAVYHPGDSFAVPDQPVSTMLLPTSGPWMKMAEAIDFLVAVRAPRAVQVHDALLSDLGRGVVEMQVGTLGGRYGVDFRHLDLRATAEI
jgi:L-ascorbate metabolism protein UlaG (beta-lactamase superfamily)